MPRTGRPPTYAANRLIRIDPEDAALLAISWSLDHRKHTTYAKGRDGGGRRCYLHQAIMGFPPRGLVVDHLNKDGLDNRRANLRVCTHRGNLVRNAPRDAGIRRDHSRWHALLGGKLLGTFASFEEALACRRAAWERACA